MFFKYLCFIVALFSVAKAKILYGEEHTKAQACDNKLKLLYKVK